MKRRDFALTLPALATLWQMPAFAQSRRDAIVLGMTLEPPGLDPTAGAASAIGEMVHYNILETLTKISSDGSVGPLLAERWEVSPDLRTYTFYLRKGVKFSNGEPFNAADGEVRVRARRRREEHQQGQAHLCRNGKRARD